MKTDYRDFEYFDFHDSYFQKVEICENRLIWYLEAVNVSSLCAENPHSCSMMASEMRLEFVDYETDERTFLFDKLAEDSYEILDVREINQDNGKYTYTFVMCSSSDYTEITLSFSDAIFEWEGYESKAWYVYSAELEFTEKFLSENPKIEWFTLNSKQSTSFVRELHSELTESHPLYCIEAMAYAKSESSDDVLFSLDNGKCAIVHLTYSRQNIEGFPKFTKFESIEEALEDIKSNSNKE